jgi:hypothetical protein
MMQFYLFLYEKGSEIYFWVVSILTSYSWGIGSNLRSNTGYTD